MINVRISGQMVALALCISLASFSAGHLLRHGRTLDGVLVFALTGVAALFAATLCHRAGLTTEPDAERTSDR